MHGAPHIREDAGRMSARPLPLCSLWSRVDKADIPEIIWADKKLEIRHSHLLFQHHSVHVAEHVCGPNWANGAQGSTYIQHRLRVEKQQAAPWTAENKHAPRNDYTKQTSNVFCLDPPMSSWALKGKKCFFFFFYPCATMKAVRQQINCIWCHK